MIYYFLIKKNYITIIALLIVLVSWEYKKESPNNERQFTSITYWNTTNMNFQTIPTITEARNFFNNQNLLFTYREGEVIYGTYYFIEIHYCPSGQYGLYGKSVKQTVLGNEQQNNWQEFGNWKIIKRDGEVGIYYKTISGVENFVPVYRTANSNLFINNEISIVNQGIAICN